MIDLHTHTTFSDGTFSPQALVKLAKDRGLSAISITDHDTADGNADALAVGQALGIDVVPGIEMSAKFESGAMHILGYWIDADSPDFQKVLRQLQASRFERNPRILEKLNELGIMLSMDQVQQETSGRLLGRLHIAKALVTQRFVKTIDEAFSRYLRDGGSAFVPKEIFSPEEIIVAILKAGGVPCLAHPYLLRGMSEQQLKDTLAELQVLGLKGVECYYPSHTSYQTEVLLAMAKSLNLCVTGGSDFHGDHRPDIQLGSLPIKHHLLKELSHARN